MQNVIYFSGIGEVGPLIVHWSHFLDVYNSYGVHVERLQNLIERMDYTGNTKLTNSEYKSAQTCLKNESALQSIDRLVYRNSESRVVYTRGRDYHLHLTSGDGIVQEKVVLELIRQRILRNVCDLGALKLELTKTPRELSEIEQALVATVLEHQKHYAMIMLFGAFNSLLAYERPIRNEYGEKHLSRDNYEMLLYQPPLERKVLLEYFEFCQVAIRNYYEFLIADQLPKVASPSQSVLDSFRHLVLPRQVENKLGIGPELGTGPKKLTFRDFDHAGQLVLFAGNVLMHDGDNPPIDSVISPLFGSIEIGFGLKAIFDSLGIDKVRNVRLIRFSRHDERDSLDIENEEFTRFIPTFMEREFLDELDESEKRIVMIDDGISTGLTLVVLQRYFSSKLNNFVEIAAVEKDLTRTYRDSCGIDLKYESRGKKETFIKYDDLVIPPIAQRSINPIPEIIKKALELN